MQDENHFVPENSPETGVRIEIIQQDPAIYKGILPDFEFTPPPPLPSPPPSQTNDTQSE